MIIYNNKAYDIEKLLHKIECNGYEKFTDFSKDIIERLPTGELIDAFIPTYANNIIAYPDISGFSDNKLIIEVESISNQLKIAIDARATFYDINGIFSVYNDFENFPIVRIYLYKFKNLSDMQNDLTQLRNNNDIKLNSCNLDELIDAKNAQLRSQMHLIDLDFQFKKLKRYINGKIDNTIIEGGVAIKRNGGNCSVCAKVIASELETVTFTGNNSGVQLAMEVCSKCLSSSKKNDLLKTIFSEIDVIKKIDDFEISINQLRKLANLTTEYYLKAKILTYASSSEDTITAVTENGFTLKVRMSSIESYGYMILSADGRELVRYDSAPHHAEHVEFMPHHVHSNVPAEEAIKKQAKRLSKKKAKELRKTMDITDSFLTGVFGIDYISIEKQLTNLSKI